MAAVNRQKIVMIGVDGAELSFILAHLPALPNFGLLLQRGLLQRLRSTGGVLPGSVWPTFYTGRPPGWHGIYHHLQWDSQAMRMRRVTADWLYCEPFWYELERRGLAVATVDVPMTFPSRLTAGTEVMNWGSHDQLGPFAVCPPSLSEEIQRRFGRHPMGYEIPVSKGPGELQRIRKDLVAGARRKGELSRWLLSMRDWDFFLTVFGETHRGGHVLWPLPSDGENGSFRALLDVYEAVDQEIGEVLNAIPDERTVILFSLHGMGTNTSQEHFVSGALDRTNDLFETAHKDNAARQASWRERSLARLFKGRLPPPFRPSSRQRSLTRLLRETVPPAWQAAIARAVPVAVRDAVVDRQITGGRAWELTPGLALLADLNGYLRFNIRGREARGMLDPEGAKFVRYVEWLRQCFFILRIGGTDRHLVSKFLLSRDEFPGSRSHYLPDAVVTWTGTRPASRIHSEVIGELTGRLATGRGGNHRSNGFCIILERGPKRSGRPEVGHILDLAPLVFSRLLGAPAHLP